MTKKHTKNIMQQGSLMIEALALLGLITMVTPVMYKKAAERTTELQDINVATQMRTLNAALDSYVRNNFSKMQELVEAGEKLIVEAKDAENDIVNGVKSYLPAGFDISQSKYFDAANIKFSIKRTENTDMSGGTHNTYTSAVLAPALNPLHLNRAAKIASMIGVNGGTIKNDTFEGTQGAWKADPQEWFGVNPSTLKHGSLMSISSEVVAEGASADSSKSLYRVADSDQEKNTMKTNLLMDGNNIKGINTLFGYNNGSDNKLYIGDNTKETNLFVKGKTEIAKALTIDSGGITVNDGGADITGHVTLKNDASIEGTLEVKGDTALKSNATIDGTLKVTGDTTLAKLTAGDTTLAKLTAGETTLESLAVTNDATIGHDLTVDNDATIKHDLTVDNDATISGNLTIGGSLISDKLHAKTRLTVGGEDPENPSVMTVENGNFTVTKAKSLFTGTDFDVITGGQQHLHMDKYAINMGNHNDPINYPRMTLFADDTNSYAELASPGGSFVSNASDTYIKMSNHDNSKQITIDDSKILLNTTDENNIKTNMHIIDGSIILEINGQRRFLTDGQNTAVSSPSDNTHAYQLLLDPNYFKIGNNSNTRSIGIDSDGEFGVKSSNVYIDNDGFAIGNNLTESNGNRENVMSNPLSAADSQKVIISRKGYIELAPPSNDGSNGNEAGFIRARRLVSDVPYYGHEDFHGNASTEGRYDYYQVNPAYTSVMNDIKLASRGGARLSDILSDYVIKGIYVADNTYNADYNEYAYTGVESDGTLIKTENTDAEGLVWDMIPIANGSPDNVFRSSDPNKQGVTKCVEQGFCEIYSCTRADCVASPWMGFVPRPQCPKNYLGVITNSPIRWRMSEVYYLTDNAKDKWLNEDATPENYNMIISDLVDNYEDPSNPDIPRRFSDYFKKHTNPRKAIFSIKDNIGSPDDPSNPDKHIHNTTASPVTFQTNTWLNSSVSPHYSNDVVDGWHILMGFLYRPKDYEALLDDMGYTGADPDSLHWNIFPVYANEMASIVTTYCAFAPTLTNTNNWNANSDDSPVLNYNQLNADTYRDPNSFDRNPVNDDTSDKGTKWEKQVNDPSLPYDDAW